MLPDSSYIAVENIHSGMATTTAGIYLLTHLPVLSCPCGTIWSNNRKGISCWLLPWNGPEFVFAALLA